MTEFSDKYGNILAPIVRDFHKRYSKEANIKEKFDTDMGFLTQKNVFIETFTEQFKKLKKITVYDDIKQLKDSIEQLNNLISTENEIQEIKKFQQTISQNIETLNSSLEIDDTEKLKRNILEQMFPDYTIFDDYATIKHNDNIHFTYKLELVSFQFESQKTDVVTNVTNVSKAIDKISNIMDSSAYKLWVTITDVEMHLGRRSLGKIVINDNTAIKLGFKTFRKSDYQKLNIPPDTVAISNMKTAMKTYIQGLSNRVTGFAWKLLDYDENYLQLFNINDINDGITTIAKTDLQSKKPMGSKIKVDDDIKKQIINLTSKKYDNTKISDIQELEEFKIYIGKLFPNISFDYNQHISTFINNIIDHVKEQKVLFIQDKSEIFHKVCTIEIQILKQDIEKTQSLQQINNEKLTEIINYITKNKDLLNYIKKECDYRRNEGEFINRELLNLRNQIGSSQKSTNDSSNDDKTIFSHIENLNPDCFEYYCSNFDNCFNKTRTNKSKSMSEESFIMETITNQFNVEKIDNITYAVFCVFNITKDAEQDPPKMPYIDLSIIQSLRNYYDLYSQNYNPSINTDDINSKVTNIDNIDRKHLITYLQEINIEEIVLIDDNKIIDFNSEHIKLEEHLLKASTKGPVSHKDYIVNSFNEILEIYEKNETIKHEAFESKVSILIEILEIIAGFKQIKIQALILPFIVEKLDDIIVYIENINALSYIGTLDFLQSMRNGGKVLTPCSKKYNFNMYIENKWKNMFNKQEHIIPNKYLTYTLLQQHVITNGEQNVGQVLDNDKPNDKLFTYNTITENMKIKYTHHNQTTQRGGQQNQIDISKLNISLDDNYQRILNNTIFYNIFKFMRWSYYKKHENIENINTYIFKDYLMTIILCVILHSIQQNNLAIGIFVDQILSMGMYYKYKNDKVMLLPYYLPFV